MPENVEEDQNLMEQQKFVELHGDFTDQVLDQADSDRGDEIDRDEIVRDVHVNFQESKSMDCLLYTSPSPRDKRQSRMPSSA